MIYSGSADASGSVRPRENQWGNFPPQLTPNGRVFRHNGRTDSNGRPDTLKRPAAGGGDIGLAKNPRLSQRQFDAQPSSDTRQSNDWGQRNTNDYSRRQWDSNPGPSGANRNPWGSGQNEQGRERGGGGRGRGNASGTSGWGINQPRQSQEVRSSNVPADERFKKLEMEMVINYELTETALNKINATAVIIDCIPFGRNNRNDPAIDVVRGLVVSLGGPVSCVVQAYFLNMGQPPSNSVFGKIRAIFSSEKFAFDFRSEATAARRRKDLPWGTSYVSNDPTKGTRVRIEILQQLAKAAQGTIEGRDADVLVSKFESRPQLLFKRGAGIFKRLTYSEALIRFGKLVDPKAYELARRIAGREYEGRMDVVFGV